MNIVRKTIVLVVSGVLILVGLMFIFMGGMILFSPPHPTPAVVQLIAALAACSAGVGIAGYGGEYFSDNW